MLSRHFGVVRLSNEGSYQVRFCALLFSLFFSRLFRLLLISHLHRKKKVQLITCTNASHSDTWREMKLLFLIYYIKNVHLFQLEISTPEKVKPCTLTCWLLFHPIKTDNRNDHMCNVKQKKCKEEKKLFYVPTREMGSDVASCIAPTDPSASCCRSSSSDSTSSDSSSSDAFSTFSPFIFASSLVCETRKDKR